MNPADLLSTQPPIDSVMPAGPQQIMLGFCILASVAISLLAIYRSVRTRTAVPVLMVIGGMIAVLYEPVADLIGNCIHPPVGQINLFTTNGHPIPWHVMLVYPVYLCVLPLLLWQRVLDGTLERALLWRVAAGTLAFAAVFEQWMLYTGVWNYYGEHSLRIGLMPVWITFVNVPAMMVPTLLVYRLLPRLAGWKQLLVVPMMPLALTATHGGTSIFMTNALGTDTAHTPALIMHGAMLATVGLSVLALWIGIELFGGPREPKPAPVRG